MLKKLLPCLITLYIGYYIYNNVITNKNDPLYEYLRSISHEYTLDKSTNRSISTCETKTTNSTYGFTEIISDHIHIHVDWTCNNKLPNSSQITCVIERHKYYKNVLQESLITYMTIVPKKQ